MSRTAARDRARTQLTETLVLLSESVALLGQSRSLIEHIDTPNAAQYLADLDAFVPARFKHRSTSTLITKLLMRSLPQ